MTAPPTLYNLEAEQALIGSLLYDPALVDELALDPGDLYVDRHRRVYSAVRGLRAKGIEPDLVTLTDLFERDNTLAEMGGAAWLTGLLLTVPNTQNVQSYARVVSDYARRRRMLAVASDLARAAHDVDAAVDDPIAAALDSLGKAGAIQRGAKPMADWVDVLDVEVQARMANPSNVWGIPTGFADIDALLGGLQPGEMFYIAGAPAVGKSKLMLNIATNAAAAGYPGAVFSLEMDGIAMTRRAVSAAGSVPTRLLKSGKLEGDSLDAYRVGKNEVAGLPLYLSDDPALTLTGLRAELSRLRSRYGIGWFALDYLLLMAGYDGLDETERSAKLSHGVRRVARDLGLAALTVNSVTKEAMDGTAAPSSSKVRGSGQVIHDADLIAFLVADPLDVTGNIRQLVFTKTRDVDGGTRSVNLYAHSQYPKFSDAVETVRLNGSNGNGRY